MNRIYRYVDYSSVREKMRPGDVIAFAGKGWVSHIIKLFTRSKVSHVGVVLNIDELGRVMVMESTTLNGKRGVQINRMSRRLEQYKGNVWWLPLSPAVREGADWAAFWDFLYKQDGKDYGTKAAIKSAIPILGKEHFDKWFCSSLVAAAHEASGVLPDINSAEVTPEDLVNMRIYAPKYFQIKGKARPI